GLVRAPSPDGDAEASGALHHVTAVVAFSLRREVVTNEIDARVLVSVRRADGHPTRELAEAIEVDVLVAEGTLRADDDEVRLRIRRIGEEDVALHELAGRDDVDELGVAAPVLRRAGAVLARVERC